jgi:hypothetical protein
MCRLRPHHRTCGQLPVKPRIRLRRIRSVGTLHKDAAPWSPCSNVFAGLARFRRAARVGNIGVPLFSLVVHSVLCRRLVLAIR